ncbi:acyl-CoA dehydrogenase family protein [Streptomyces sp. NRRL F-5065]|uniref:acyl-CoA dehydrogenase family protein n=1 Tax=Streptomyces sp. NRRL F-5065 TaxID=1463855 RepID=UPI0018FEA0A9|nr:acyl-CoA dehydrogenase family protein [Streptomyces sp. NRRL F-5065]
MGNNEESLAPPSGDGAGPVARAAALRDVLREGAEEADREGRLPEKSVLGLTEAGLMRLMTPRRLGGYQGDARTLLEVAIEVGRGCCASGWITGVVNAGNFVVSLFPERTREEVWSDNPDARTALVLGRPVTTVENAAGGIVVDGRWGYASGCLHADWMGGLVLADDGSGRPAPHFALMPMGELTVEDDWRFTGMRGTGSNTVVADRVFVPRHRLLPYLPVLHGETDGLVDPGHAYRNSLTGIFSIGLIGSLVGGADEAFRHVRERAPHRPVAGSSYDSQAASPAFQADLAQAAAKIETARLLALSVTDRIDAHAAAGKNPDLVTRARARMESTHVTQLCREAVDILMTAYGSSAFAESSPLQRIWRDVNVGSRHAGFGMGIPQQVYGSALVGRDPRDISLLV